jgi:hypothetical protein
VTGMVDGAVSAQTGDRHTGRRLSCKVLEVGVGDTPWAAPRLQCVHSNNGVHAAEFGGCQVVSVQ